MTQAQDIFGEINCTCVNIRQHRIVYHEVCQFIISIHLCDWYLYFDQANKIMYTM